MSSQSDKQRSLAGGVSILGIAGLICKVVGVLYRIPLVNSIGALGVAVYQQVFPTYNLLLVISSAGIPVAISRMVAHHMAKQDPDSARQVFTVALRILILLGIVTTALMLVFSGALSHAAGTAESRLGFQMIAPSLFLVCVMSAFRGYMQGRRRMVPTAISQLIEQVGKVGIAIPLAMMGMRRGGYAMGAAGALLGTSIAEAAALIYMMVDYYFVHPRLPALTPEARNRMLPEGRVARELVFIAIPITIGACIVPLAGAIDSFMLVNIMRGYMTEVGAKITFGVYAGMVLTLINVPTALAMAMATNLVPAISSARALDDSERIRSESATGLRLASVVGFPAAIGMSMLAEPILLLLFGGGKDSVSSLLTGAQLLRVSSLTILLFTQVQATSAILQGLHKQRIPMYTLAAGMALKVALNYALVRLPDVNIQGAPYASLLCYAVSLVPNLYYTARYGRMKLNFNDIFTRPGLATLIMALPVAGLMALFGARLNHSWLRMGATLAVAALVYLVAAYKLRAIKPDDLPSFIRRRLTRHA
jgi:stage V sporulation protein B